MLAAHAWAKRYEITERPWLILGKGPSFARFTPLDAEGRFVLALNHVARDVACDAALMMDYDVFDACADHLAANAQYVIMPWRPHVEFRPGKRTLSDFVKEDSRLAALEAEGRLVFFNALTARDFPAHPDEPITPIKFFSAEAALNLLAANGAKRVETLGVDGGGSYAPAFSDLSSQTLLANGREDFNRQFEQFARTMIRHPDLTFGPLGVEKPVRIFIGADETQRLGARVLEYSIRTQSSLSTQFQLIDNEGLPVPSDDQRKARTGFSFSRFKIPALCGHQGRAIYLDADMLVFTDIKDLWARETQDAWILHSEWGGADGRAPQFSVMLMDCEHLAWDAKSLIEALDRGEYDYKSLMHDFAMMPPERKRPLLESAWNSLEVYEPGITKLLHYTDMPTQPWVNGKNKNGAIWYDALRRALSDGFIVRAEIDEAIEAGHVSPSMPEWAGLKPYAGAKALSRAWSAPFKRFAAQVRGKR